MNRPGTSAPPGTMDRRGWGRVGEPLIGVEDMETPRWAEGYASTAKAGLRAVAAKAPGTAVT